jgi:2-methylisocitrate lyase-like PEP mutase family enzyme
MPRPALASLLSQDAPLVLPGVYDALSAKLAARAGFPVVFVSGYCLSASLLGEPDFGFISHAEVVDAADRILAAVDVPVLVDIDTGYGNAFNVERVVHALVRRGAAGCFLEDQVWPKRCGHMEQKRVVPLDEYIPKLRAAIEARGDAPFHITARTDARAMHGLDEAITRARAFAEAGADAVFVEAPQSIEEMRAIRSALPAHVKLVANMVEHGKTPLRTAPELADDGFEIIVVPVAGLLAATHALEGVFSALMRDGISSAYGDRMTRFGEMNDVLGLPDRYAREAAWRKDEA